MPEPFVTERTFYEAHALTEDVLRDGVGFDWIDMREQFDNRASRRSDMPVTVTIAWESVGGTPDGLARILHQTAQGFVTVIAEYSINSVSNLTDVAQVEISGPLCKLGVELIKNNTSGAIINSTVEV